MTGNYYVRPELPQKCPFILDLLLENRIAELPFALGSCEAEKCKWMKGDASHSGEG